MADLWSVRRTESGSWPVLCPGGTAVGTGTPPGCTHASLPSSPGSTNRKPPTRDPVTTDTRLTLLYKIHVVYVLVFFHINLIITFLGLVFSHDCGDIKTF